jgi:hypothetical protein
LDICDRRGLAGGIDIIEQRPDGLPRIPAPYLEYHLCYARHREGERDGVPPGGVWLRSEVGGAHAQHVWHVHDCTYCEVWPQMDSQDRGLRGLLREHHRGWSKARVRWLRKQEACVGAVHEVEWDARAARLLFPPACYNIDMPATQCLELALAAVAVLTRRGTERRNAEDRLRRHRESQKQLANAQWLAADPDGRDEVGGADIHGHNGEGHNDLSSADRSTNR